MATIVLVSLCAIGASTSVGAAPSSSKTSVKATPDLVGSPIAAGTGPAACTLNGSSSMYVFVKGNDGALWYRIWSTSTYGWFSEWVSLGGQLTSSPSAVSREAGYIDVFVRGTNGAVYDIAYFGGAWHAWYNVGGQVASNTGPGASGWPGREDVFVTGTNGALYQKTWNSSNGWSGWTTRGGVLTSSPAAVSRQTGIIDVFVRGTNGAVYQNSFHYESWTGFSSMFIGGQVASGTGPAVCSYGPLRLDIFVEGTNGALYHKTFDEGWLVNWVKVGGQLSASPTAGTSVFGSGQVFDVFVRGTNGLLYVNIGDDTTWLGWNGCDGPP